VRAFATLLLVLVAGGCGGGEPTVAAPPPETTARAAPPRETRPQALPHPPRAESALRLARRLLPAHGHRVARLEAVAASLTGIAPEVHCWDVPGWKRIERATNEEFPPEDRFEIAGLADLYDARIDLAPWVCEILAALPSRRGLFAELDVADALHILAHETRHLTAAGGNEAAAECAGLQRIAPAGVALGLTARHAQHLARRVWLELYPSLPAAYRSSQCRPGGALDREPESPAFP
jgi:hypothetical protein